MMYRFLHSDLISRIQIKNFYNQQKYSLIKTWTKYLNKVFFKEIMQIVKYAPEKQLTVITLRKQAMPITLAILVTIMENTKHWL